MPSLNEQVSKSDSMTYPSPTLPYHTDARPLTLICTHNIYTLFAMLLSPDSFTRPTSHASHKSCWVHIPTHKDTLAHSNSSSSSSRIYLSPPSELRAMTSRPNTSRENRAKLICACESTVWSLFNPPSDNAFTQREFKRRENKARGNQAYNQPSVNTCSRITKLFFE